MFGDGLVVDDGRNDNCGCLLEIESLLIGDVALHEMDVDLRIPASEKIESEALVCPAGAILDKFEPAMAGNEFRKEYGGLPSGIGSETLLRFR